MIDEIYNKYTNIFLKSITEKYGIKYELLKYYWDTLYQECQHVYIQGDKKDCSCKNKVKIIGGHYCKIHRKNNTKNIILKKNKTIGKFWHPTTRMVFNDERRVIGYYNGTDIVELNDKLKKMCKRFKFKVKT